MTINWRRLVIATIGVAALIGGPAARAADAVELKLWMTGVGLDKYMKDQVVSQFEKENPGIKVEATNLSWTSYQQKILTGIAANDGPDVLSFYSVDVAPWAARGVLTALDGKFDADLFIPSALANGRWDGKVYALPIGLRMRPLYYRADFLKAAGFDKPPATWEELRTYASRLVKKDAAGNIERVGFWVPTNHPYKTVQMWLSFLWNAGGDVLAPDGRKAIFNSPEGVEATQFLADLIRADKVDVPGAIKIDNVDFAQGRVAMLVSNIVTRDLVKNFPQLKAEVGVAMVPARKGSYVELSGDMIGVAKASRHPAEAAKLINFIAARAEIALKYYEIDQNLPSLKSVASSDYAKNDPWIPTYLKLVDKARPLPAHPRWTEIASVLTKALDSVYVEGRPAKAALDEAAATADEILARP
jgi:ABC-type glycerol-3-phosphate transport system substrate-binding protein